MSGAGELRLAVGNARNHHRACCKQVARTTVACAEGGAAINLLEQVAATLLKRAENAEREVAVSDRINEMRKPLLDLFECEAHGQGCIPHAIEEVAALRMLVIRPQPDETPTGERDEACWFHSDDIESLHRDPPMTKRWRAYLERLVAWKKAHR